MAALGGSPFVVLRRALVAAGWMGLLGPVALGQARGAWARSAALHLREDEGDMAGKTAQRGDLPAALGPNDAADSDTPVALYLPAALDWPDFDAAEMAQAAREGQGLCHSIARAWPTWIRGVQRATRAVPREAFLQQGFALEGAFVEAAARCGAWAGALHLQRALLLEHRHLYRPTHAADAASHTPLPEGLHLSMRQLEDSYDQLHEEAWVAASSKLSRAWTAWRLGAALRDAAARPQRFLMNAGTDDGLVLPPDGSFVSLSACQPLPEVADRLAVLQGQGPVLPGDVRRYVQASLDAAQRLGAGRLLFVNAAQPQIPSFAGAVASLARKQGLVADYVAFEDWLDGGLVTPERAAEFAAALVQQLALHAPGPQAEAGKVLLVTNCNAGLDRSGTLNTLVQVMVAAEQDRAAGFATDAIVARSYVRVPAAVRGLKAVRPSAISSFGRYVFVHRATAAFFAQPAWQD